MPTPMIIPTYKHTVLWQPFSFIFAQQLRDTYSILMRICSFLYVIFMLLFVIEQSNVTVKAGQVFPPRFY